ncbi:hypothetical protein [Parasitella parasitica]|uniref:Uncharacterized protein n=1 Tax=Parasitella parasitica TaxID=35722 RepID=A0A0B7MXK1_9FUNG|nr:hypothetical protein [Parasitella parasitica]
MGDSFRVEPQGKSWADIVEEDEELDLSQDEGLVGKTKEEVAQELIQNDTTRHPENSIPETEALAQASDPPEDKKVECVQQSQNPTENKQAESVHQPLENEVARQESPDIKEKPALVGSQASKWASAPSESSTRQNQCLSTTATSTLADSSLKSGSSASKWATAPNTTSRSRYDNDSRNNSNNRPGSNDRYGGSEGHGSTDGYRINGRYGNNDRYGNSNNFRRNNRWQEDSKPATGRLNRSAFEDRISDDARNGGFDNKANFSKEKRYQDYYDLTQKESDETPETKQAIESWNAYKPPVQDKTASQAGAETALITTEAGDHQGQEPTKATVEASFSSPSLLPVSSSISWADDIPDDDANDDITFEGWIAPKASTQHVVNEIEKSTIGNMPSTKLDKEFADAAWNPLPSQSTSEDNALLNGESAATTITEESPTTSTTARTLPPKEVAPTHTWGSLNDYKKPETIIPKSPDVPTMSKDEEEAAIASWQSANLTKEPVQGTVAEEGHDSTTNEQPSWTQSTKSLWIESTEPSSIQSAEPSWSQPAVEGQPSPSTEKQHKQEPVSEPKPTYKWGPLNDYKEPKVIAKPQSDVNHLSKQDEAAAIAAWKDISQPQESHQTQEQVNGSSAWSALAQKTEPIQAEASWDIVDQPPKPTQSGSSCYNTSQKATWNNVSQEATWNSVPQQATWDTAQQSTWPESLTAANQSYGQQPQDCYSTTSTASNKSSVKSRTKLPTNAPDNTAGWKSFAETSAIMLEKKKDRLKKEEKDISSSNGPFKENPAWHGAIPQSSHPAPLQQRPHELSFNLNDFDDTSNNPTNSSSPPPPTQPLPYLRKLPGAILTFSELNRRPPPETTTEVSLKLSDMSPSSSTARHTTRSDTKEPVYRLSDLQRTSS